MSKNGGKFLLGAAIGIGLGILFAPKSGKETRAEIKAKFDEILERINETDLDDLKVSFQKKISSLEADLKDLDKEKVLKIAKDKAKKIEIKLEDLVVEAGKAAKPKIDELVASAKAKTIKTLKVTLDKLENKTSKS